MKRSALTICVTALVASIVNDILDELPEVKNDRIR